MSQPAGDAAELARLRAENRALRSALAALAAPSPTHAAPPAAAPPAPPAHHQPLTEAPEAAAAASPPPPIPWVDTCGHGLSPAQLSRFARHVALPSFGAAGQGALARARVLLVGAGGLGSPAALYLAASGVGSLTIADSDVVELSNLHRQIVHAEARVGTSKAASAAAACAALNSGCAVRAAPAVCAATAFGLAARHDIVLDCTDNAQARYLLSDAAVAAGVPLISGAAVGTEGQVTVLCGPLGADGSRPAPCYRCLYRQAAPPAHCARCADAGVLGPVPGVIGTLQAVEALKVLSGVGAPLRGRLLLYDALSERPFYATQLAPPDAGCPACGRDADVALRGEALAAYDYAAFVAGPPAPPPAQGAAAATPPPPQHARVTCQEYAAAAAAGEPHLLVDVRPRHMFQTAALRGAHGLPYTTPHAFAAEFAARFPAPPPRVVLICRRGNASQHAAAALVAAGVGGVCDVIGGVTAWRDQLDATFPV